MGFLPNKLINKMNDFEYAYPFPQLARACSSRLL